MAIPVPGEGRRGLVSFRLFGFPVFGSDLGLYYWVLAVLVLSYAFYRSLVASRFGRVLASGPTEHTIAKKDIKIVNGKPAVRQLALSLMPEGLEQIPDKDFRDLIMYILNPPQDNPTSGR